MASRPPQRSPAAQNVVQIRTDLAPTIGPALFAGTPPTGSAFFEGEIDDHDAATSALAYGPEPDNSNSFRIPKWLEELPPSKDMDSRLPALAQHLPEMRNLREVQAILNEFGRTGESGALAHRLITQDLLRQLVEERDSGKGERP